MVETTFRPFVGLAIELSFFSTESFVPVRVLCFMKGNKYNDSYERDDD